MTDLDLCRGCHVPITWAKTPNDEWMPIEPRRGGNVLAVPVSSGVIAKTVAHGQGDHVSHFATCPDAKRFRRAH